MLDLLPTDRRDCIAGTGHRPNKLRPYSFDKLVQFLAGKLYAMEPAPVLSGLALGFDTAWAIAAQEVGYPLLCFVPFPGQANNWPVKDRIVRREIINSCNDVCLVSKTYHDKAYGDRNKKMVDRSAKVIALWDGTKGGTSHCVRYATKRKVPVINLYEEWKAL